MALNGTRPTRVCVVRQHYVPRDTRVARAVGALTEAGFAVDVVCLRAPGEPAREELGLLRMHRLPLRHRQGGGALGYAVEYAAFLVAATAVVAARHLVARYRLVQIHSLPDVLVLAGLVPRLLGARVLLDLQECMPEFFATKFGVGPTHPVVRLLERLEQRAITLADHAVTPTDQMRAVFVARGADPQRITTIMDGADPSVFVRPAGARPLPGDRHFTLVSHGTVAEHYGLDTVLRAVALLREEIPELRLEVYGDGPDLPRLRALADTLELGDAVRFSGRFVPEAELVDALGRADLGVLAVRRDPFRDVALPGKIFDFIAMGLPVVASRTRSMAETFGDGVELFTSDDPADLARAVRALHHDPARRAELVAAAHARSRPLRWERQRLRYLAVVADLLAGREVAEVESGVSVD
ncbi:glycosyltransferase [Actinomycetospora sp. TBRC 11914]|uniref:glycosyltransferase n=1 Tax=Actinomycetospora sp. TBRC 11914 TaxID=2729387 RepID=UPI00145E8494|nr:glycosyltransferase [Actinomycetospora sp. TBRC 11914]NMO90388.1 glycosyltransferase family 4 protein [Actinomycetospora sp. TBRC 11914]